VCGGKVKDRVPNKELRQRVGLDDLISVLQQNRFKWLCCKKKTKIWRINILSMKWRVQDQKVDKRGHGERLCKKTVKQVN